MAAEIREASNLVPSKEALTTQGHLNRDLMDYFSGGGNVSKLLRGEANFFESDLRHLEDGSKKQPAIGLQPGRRTERKLKTPARDDG